MSNLRRCRAIPAFWLLRPMLSRLGRVETLQGRPAGACEHAQGGPALGEGAPVLED